VRSRSTPFAKSVPHHLKQMAHELVVVLEAVVLDPIPLRSSSTPMRWS
jgi:hypothetical protein